MAEDDKTGDEPEKRYRSMMEYGTGEAVPSASLRQHFGVFSLALSEPIAVAVETALLNKDHDFTRGSDGVELVAGMIPQTAAEVWAARHIFTGGVAPLTILHHARALYEGHATAYWMFQDFDKRWPRVLKEALTERERFERAARASIGEVLSDLSDPSLALVNDQAVSKPPSLWDMTPGNAVLQYDHAIFWKYASAFTHPGNTYTGTTNAHDERVFIEQMLAGVIRHSSATLRLIVNQFALDIGDNDPALSEAEEYSRYSFDVVETLGTTFRP